MMDLTVIDYFVIVLQALGLLVFFATVVGINRLPDFYTRLHAASKGDTMSSLCLLGGFALYVLKDFDFAHCLLAAKILFIILFIFISSPTASHALAEAAYKTGARPTKNKKGEKK